MMMCWVIKKIVVLKSGAKIKHYFDICIKKRSPVFGLRNITWLSP